MTVSSLFLLSLVLLHGRVLSQQSLVSSPQTEQPIDNTTVDSIDLQARWNSLLRYGPYSALQEQFIIRLEGPEIVPLTLATQELLIQAFQASLMQHGPVEAHTYKEGYLVSPEGASLNTSTAQPYVDIAGTAWHILAPATPPGSSTNTNNSGIGEGWSSEYDMFLTWVVEALRLGLNATVRLLYINIAETVLVKPVVLHPMVPVQAILFLSLPENQTLESGSAWLSPDITSALEKALFETLVRNSSASTDKPIASHVEILSLNSTAIMRSLSSEAVATLPSDSGPAPSLMLVDITMAACPAQQQSATVGECEATAALAALNSLIIGPSWSMNAEYGVGTVHIVSVYPRPSPTALPTPSQSQSPSKAPATSVPWHLDRIDQRHLPLDDQFTADAPGTGVNVYLISSGIRGDHAEFKHLGDDPHGGTSRIKPLWGYQGLDPLQDCSDGVSWYHFGTYAASIIGGLTAGVAKNVTIWSVRTRADCLFESPDIWSPGGLPSAIDAVLSTFERPGVLVIDTWWSRDRMQGDADDYIEAAIKDRLDKARRWNIPIIAPSGLTLENINACDNIFSQDDSIIRVGGTNAHDHRTFSEGAVANASCIDIWAPGGGLAGATRGASAKTNTSFTNVIPGAFGASWLVAGVAAQWLQGHPNATAAELKAALLQLATDGAVIAPGVGAPSALLYTNLTSNGVQVQDNAENDDGGSSTSVGLVAGMSAMGVVLGLIVAFIVVYFSTRQNRVKDSKSSPSGSDGRTSSSGGVAHNGTTSPSADAMKAAELASTDGFHDWEISKDRIMICMRDDQPLLLGVGQWGNVYQGIKDGLQSVAVKTLRRCDDSLRSQFIQEIALMQLISRDPGIVQFYGACVRHDTLWLVVELMEGGDLRRALTGDTGGDLRWYSKGKSIVLDAVRGLHFLHSNNVVHRDIKSKNILLTKENRAKLSDVGLARIVEESGYLHDGFIGTLAWAAPELLLNDRCTEKADIYSMGVVLWEIVTQEIPRRGGTRRPVVPDECPEEVADIIELCMRTDPVQRPTAKELFSMLRGCPPMNQFDDADGHLEGLKLTEPENVKLSASLTTDSLPITVAGGEDTANSSSSLTMIMATVSPRLKRVVKEIRQRLQTEAGPSTVGGRMSVADSIMMRADSARDEEERARARGRARRGEEQQQGTEDNV